MQIFKFGGASVSSEKAIRNMAGILGEYRGKPVLVVVSAMGKTTNRLENVLIHRNSPDLLNLHLSAFRDFHHDIIRGLFPGGQTILESYLDQVVQEINTDLTADIPPNERYDRVVSQGELLSTRIIAHYLGETGMASRWMDARQYILTDDHFREGHVDWEETYIRISALAASVNKDLIITQGFIGAARDGRTTTLGREGSDFSAAIFASCLKAESVTVWKDVEGIMNGDPKRMEGTIKYDELPYQEAAEMTYYGASVIHPKTIKPLANQGIPLYVKSFFTPGAPGTVIHNCSPEGLPPAVIIKDKQCLVSFQVRDFTFINENHLSQIYHQLSEADMKVNLMQNSAISLSVIMDYDPAHLDEIMSRLRGLFRIRYNTGLELLTIKNYTQPFIDKFKKDRDVLLEQVSRNNYRAVMKTVTGHDVPPASPGNVK